MTTVLSPLETDALKEAEPAPGSLVNAIENDPDALVYFLLNVGDGDTQVLLLPPDTNTHKRRLVIVDVATARKVPALLDTLHQATIVQGSDHVPILTEPPGSPGQICILVATHPHFDHIGGMAEMVRLYGGPGGAIDQFWEPGFYFPTPTFHGLMFELENSPWIRRLRPTSGTSYFIDAVKITVVGPGVGLATRFDTYGVGINDSSITMMVDYPAARLYADSGGPVAGRRERRIDRRRGRRLLLGADAQFTSWAQATVDFPAVLQQQNPSLAQGLRAAQGRDYLSADIFKLSHHASKHGITLELMERVAAKYVFVSSTGGGGSYNFPHALAMEAAREASQPITSSGASRRSDHALGIHVTGGLLADPAQSSLGSIAAVVPRSTRRGIRLFRLMDTPRAMVDLALAREIVT